MRHDIQIHSLVSFSSSKLTYRFQFHFEDISYINHSFNSSTMYKIPGFLNLVLYLSLTLNVVGLGAITAVGEHSSVEVLEHKVCPKGHEVCDFQCFDPKTHNCIQQGGFNTSCPIGLNACGSDCYESGSQSHVCHEFEGTGILCPVEAKRCGYTCYIEDKQKCINDTTCSKDEEVCQGICYNIEASVCHDGILCSTGQERCGFDCFEPSPNKSCTVEGQVCASGEKSCAGECYVPSEGDTCFRGIFLCRNFSSICGNRCFSPQNGDKCLNEYAVCRPGQKLCGKYTCYSPDEGQQCFEDDDGNSGTVCGRNESFCGGTCYDKETNECFIFEGNGVLCPKGQINCSSIDCYSSEDQVCLTNEKGQSGICKKGESLCGKTCYSKGDNRTCIEQEFPYDDVLCENGQKTCGYNCYDPEIQSCLVVKSPIRPL